MVKNTEPEVVAKPKKNQLKKAFYKLLFLVAVAGAAYVLWKNPQLTQKIRAALNSNNTVEATSGLEGQLSNLNAQLQNLQYQFYELANRQDQGILAEFQQLSERMDAVEKTNLNVIDSKADVATVLGLLTRVDKLEDKLDKMAKVTDEGALILTAVMLVKDGAERGGSFEYEIEVLQQIASDNLQVRQPIEIMAQYAAEGIATREELDNSFSKIYAKMLKAQKNAFEKTWKDRLNSKLSEIVQIKRVNEHAPKFEANQGLEAVKQAVDDGNLQQAVWELSKPSNAALLQDEELREWQKAAQANVNFHNAVSRISASSLAMMKVNFLKNVTKNN